MSPANICACVCVCMCDGNVTGFYDNKKWNVTKSARVDFVMDD